MKPKALMLGEFCASLVNNCFFQGWMASLTLSRFAASALVQGWINKPFKSPIRNPDITISLVAGIRLTAGAFHPTGGWFSWKRMRIQLWCQGI